MLLSSASEEEDWTFWGFVQSCEVFPAVVARMVAVLAS